MTEEDSETTEHRRGIPTARAFWWTAKLALGRFLAVYRKEPRHPYDEILYYGSFWIFAKSALEALAKSDGLADSSLNDIQSGYFHSVVKTDPVFKVLQDERHRIGHGDDSWASHPFLPITMVDRFLKEGFDLFEISSSGLWPDGHFKGKEITEVMATVLRTLSVWLDEVDARHFQQHPKMQGSIDS